jgi:hypothetical protein
MMKFRLAGLVVIMLLVLGLTVSAEAHEFVASGSGTLKATKGKEVFTLGSNKVTCTEMAVKGRDASTKEQEQLTGVRPEKCEAFGAKVTVSETEFDFEAEDGAAEVGADVVITDATGKCSVKIESGGSEGSLKYADTNKDVKTTTTATEVEWDSSGGVCGEAEKGFTNGSIEAEATVELEKGTIEWK